MILLYHNVIVPEYASDVISEHVSTLKSEHFVPAMRIRPDVSTWAHLVPPAPPECDFNLKKY